jgi:hypothetical protein
MNLSTICEGCRCINTEKIPYSQAQKYLDGSLVTFAIIISLAILGWAVYDFYHDYLKK